MRAHEFLEAPLCHLSMFGYKTTIQLTPKRGIYYECSDKPIITTQTQTQTLD